MILLSPFDRPEEVEPLVRAGAQELYGGVQPASWSSPVLSANQRSFASAQVTSEGAFSEAVTEATRLGAPTHLVLNAPLYGASVYSALLRLAERAAGWGVTGVVVGDPGLLLRLREARLPLEVTLSTLAGALNRAAFGLFRELGARRAVLPRHLSLSEIGALVAARPDLTFEAFVLIGKCPNEEGYCTFQHTSSSQRWPCEIPYALEVAAGGPVPDGHPLARWHADWRTVDRRLACGLCALGSLGRLGVRVAKLVGRGGPTAGKVANVRLVAGFVRGDRSREEARRAYKERFGCRCHALSCYFPDLHASHGSPDVA